MMKIVINMNTEIKNKLNDIISKHFNVSTISDDYWVDCDITIIADALYEAYKLGVNDCLQTDYKLIQKTSLQILDHVVL